MESISILVASLLLEAGIFELADAFIVFASLQVLCGGVWMFTVVPAEKREKEDKL